MEYLIESVSKFVSFHMNQTIPSGDYSILLEPTISYLYQIQIDLDKALKKYQLNELDHGFELSDLIGRLLLIVKTVQNSNLESHFLDFVSELDLLKSTFLLCQLKIKSQGRIALITKDFFHQ